MHILSPKATAPSENTVMPGAQEMERPGNIISFHARKSNSGPIDPKTLTVPGAIKGGKGGEGGEPATPSTPSTPSNAGFIGAIFSDLPEGATAVVTAKSGNPEKGGWTPNEASNAGATCRSNLNTYFNCSSLNRQEDGTLAARKEYAAAYHTLVLDDVGTKVERSLLGDIVPTWELETSPGNYQVGFKLNPPLRTSAEVEQFQRGIADAGLTDTGALGMVRWARLPNGINGKPKYEKDGKPFQCHLTRWHPEKSYSAEAIVKALVPERPERTTAARATVRSTIRCNTDNAVYVPRAAVNPVISALKEQGLYKREISPGRHDVTCPWVAEHTDDLDTGTAYFEPNERYPSGGFCCQHSHGDQYHISELLAQLDLSWADARNRAVIRVTERELDTILLACEDVLAQEGELYQSGGMIVSVKNDPLSGDATLVSVDEAALTRKLSQLCDWEKYNAKREKWVPADPPQRHVNLLNRADSYDRLPVLRGLARQPFYREGDGQLVMTPGYDGVSQRLGVFDASKYRQPVATREAAVEALALLKGLLSEFHFVGDVDRAAALSAIFTAAIRPSLGLAPAFHVTAPSSGSGKSYLCETIALFAGAGAPAKTSYPKTPDEATKSILSLLLAAPAVVEFDDMDTDWLPHGTINRMLTSPTITDRILGVSKVATVGTSVLFLGSGNNVGPLRDLMRRVLTIHLNPQSESPATLAYQDNPVAMLRAKRERYVSAVLTIIEAWKAAGAPKTNVPSIASYGGTWSDYCRHPLIWLGEPDPVTTMLHQITQDPDSELLGQLLRAWHGRFGDRPMQVRQILRDRYEGDLWETLMELPVIETGRINNAKFGWYLKRNCDRIVGGFKLEKIPNSERNTWRVVQTAPPSPIFPPSVEPAPADVARRPEDAF